MSVADNIRLLDAGNKALNDHDVERFLSLHLPSVIQRDPQNVEPTKGREAVRAGLEPMIQAFPDFHVVRERAFGEGDWVVEQGHALGTHRGPLETPAGPTIPATNKPIRLRYAFIAKVEGGKFAETNLYFDVAGMMAQLGIGPASQAQNEGDSRPQRCDRKPPSAGARPRETTVFMVDSSRDNTRASRPPEACAH